MNRPYVIINCAMSADGKTALPSGKQLRISSDEDIARMYNLRNECDAVLVGINTILSDDPKLTVKEKYVKNPNQPLRVVLDSRCRITPDKLVMDSNAKTLIITKKGNEKQFKSVTVEVIGCKTDKNDFLDLNCVIKILDEKGIKKLLVEGGGTIIWSFLKNNLVDELFIFIGSIIIGGKNTPSITNGFGIENDKEVISLKLQNIKNLGSGVLLHYTMI